MVIPALDEEQALPLVLAELPPGWIEEVVVCDNGSRDRTAQVARAHGATVVAEPRRGYGSACQRALRHLRERPGGPPQVVVFLDADHSDHPEELPALLRPILEGQADLVIGSRALRDDARAALLPQARWGNLLAVSLIRWLWGARFTDLGPFRAITWSALEQARLRDPDFGWTVELQVRAAQLRLRAVEVPVRYRARVGTSKISGTVKGSLRAGKKILSTIARFRLEQLAGAGP